MQTPTKTLAIVKFQYPSSTNDDLVLRMVQVEELTMTHIKGYELNSDGNKFKCYKLSKIPQNGICLVKYGN